MPRVIVTAVGSRLREFLKEKEISQAELAAMCNLQQPQVNSLITGRNNLTIKLALALERGTNIPGEEWIAMWAKEELDWLRVHFKAAQELANIQPSAL